MRQPPATVEGPLVRTIANSPIRRRRTHPRLPGLRRSAFSRFGLAATVTSVALTGACWWGPPQGYVAERLIPTTAELPTDGQALRFGSEPAWRLSFVVGDPDHATWTLDEFTTTETPRDGSAPLLRTTGADPKAITRVTLDAESAPLIELHAEGDVNQATLFWAPPHEPFTAKRQLRGEVVSQGRTVVFRLAGHPEWTGPIRRIRIDPTNRPNSTVRLISLDGFAPDTSDQRLDRLASESVLLDIGNQLRPARVLVPGRPVHWQVTPKTGDVLRLTLAGLNDLVTSQRIVLRAASDPEITLVDAELAPDAVGSWKELEVEIPSAAVGIDTWLFEAITASDWTPDDGFVAVGDPVLTRKTRQGRPNVLLISIDTLRADHVSACGYERKTTPNLDAWFGQRGVVFTSMVASSPWTLPSHVTMFSGQEALRHGANYSSIPDPARVELLAERLRAEGYTSAAWTGGAFLSPSFGMAAGFDEYRWWRSRHDPEELETHARALVDWMEAHRGRRTFTLLHTYEVHSPFRPRAPHFEAFAGPDTSFDGFVTIDSFKGSAEDGYLPRKGFRIVTPDIERPVEHADHQLVTDLYDAGIAYTDRILGEMLTDLESRGLLENTLVVVTSDHGEGLGEHGLYAHAYLYDFNILVPMLISGPGVTAKGRVVRDQVRMSDLTPTVLDLLGLEPGEDVDGMALRPLVSSGEITLPAEAWSYAPKTNRGLAIRVANRQKVIFNNTAWAPLWGHTEVFDLDNDPTESRNLVESDEDAGKESLGQLLDTLDQSPFGLDLRISNPADEPLVLRIGFGPEDSLLVFKVKSHRQPPPDLRVVPGRTLRIEVPGGASAHLTLEDVLSPTLRVTSDRGRAHGDALDERIEKGLLQPAWRSSLDGDSWRHGSRLEGRVQIELAWRRVPVGTKAVDLSQDLVDQLEALGYVER